MLGEYLHGYTHAWRRHRRQTLDVLRGYNLDTARRDLVAGLTVAVVAIPQSMAYAIIAGLVDEPQYGLYTVIFQALIASLLNSHPQLSVGPTNTQSLLVASIVSRIYAPGDGPTYLALVIALSMLKGLIQLALSLGRLGSLVRYVSRSVIVGFTAGAGVLIAAGQAPAFLGVATEPRTAAQWPGLIGIAQRTFPHLHEVSPYAVGLGVAALAIVIVARLISRFVPGPLLAILICAGAVGFWGWGPEHLQLIPAFERALPTPSLPTVPLDLLEPLLTGAVALALLGLMEAYSIGRTLAIQTGHKVSANQELAAQGVTNFASSFLGCFPGSGSFARSALNHYAGARTFLAGVYMAVFVLVIFLALAPAARFVPMTAIAAVLFVAAAGLVDWSYLRRVVATSRADTMVCAGTFVATLTMPLAWAVFSGVAFNILLYLRRSSQLHLSEMRRAGAGIGGFQERPLSDRSGNEKVLFLQLEGDLFFAVADELQEAFQRLVDSPMRVAILRVKRTHWIDTTVLGVLEEFVDRMNEKGGHVILCGMREELVQRLDHFGLIDRIGRENVFPTEYGVFTSAKKAIARARQLVGSSIDNPGLLEDDPAPLQAPPTPPTRGRRGPQDDRDAAAWTYDI